MSYWSRINEANCLFETDGAVMNEVVETEHRLVTVSEKSALSRL